ncbi:hypothetical protein AK812_SmicGene16765 [Symbiodinium microadriaticum]|uniref:Uncharacterized protein n=1 Tax=Symbiodinium microadriaticum TaxID=2951 RepID=A0A1Q9DZH7_SYMMI|nr:hypothetical protein AK812_SmicGene16765 [Symbiodinium microadriaticum]CAE7231304.1 unnamed protein product [Symbiodinium sp. KB8]CAE7362646.1 unnamed protein product [Symbiodinium microadriaticum]
MAQFSDDAYNTKLQPGAGAGTLIGNWFEERILRDSSGEGRTVPQRHVPRSGLLKDWTKVPTVPRKGDDTFDRVYGPKSSLQWEAASHMIGKGDDSTPTILREGPLTVALKSAHHDGAETEVQQEDAIVEEVNHARYFETSTGIAHQKPDYTVAEKATHTSKSYAQEIRCGPEPDQMPALDNEGLEVPFHAHYSGVEQITNQRMFLADSEFRNNVKASAATGVGAFHRNSEFTKGCDKFILGVRKDEALNAMYTGLKDTQPLRHLGGELAPNHFAGIPSLAALKATIHQKVQEAWGPMGYVSLRQRLFDFCDHEGFVPKGNVVAVLREQLGVTEEEVPSKPLDVWLTQLVTMKKDELTASTFMSSLRPALPQKDKRRVLTAFKLLQGPNSNGIVRLGDWLQRLDDGEVKQTVVLAFGAEDEESVANTTVTERVFLELFSDLAPFLDIDSLLQ